MAEHERLSDDDILQREWKEILGPESSGLVDVYRRSVDFEAYLTRHPEAQELARYAGQKVADSLQAMMENVDTTSADYRSAHFEARVGTEILNWMDRILVEGRDAETAFLADQDMSDEQEETNG